MNETERNSPKSRTAQSAHLAFGGHDRATGPSSSRLAVSSAPVRARFDDFELDEANARLLHRGEPVGLPPTPFAVLCALVRQPGTLINKNALLDAIWGHRFVSDSVLKTAVSELRMVLGDAARHPRYIETVPRRGYRFVGATGTIPTRQSTDVSVAPASQAPPITGRVEGLAQLRASWSRACAGERSAVWVVGDPGIGKTTLIDHFVASLSDVALARGQCIEQYGAGEPYFPILVALAELCRRDGAALPLLRSVAPVLLLQFPWLCTPQDRDILRQVPADVHPYHTLRELAEFFDRYSDRRPLLLVTEDLHWSDYATIQLFDHIARRRGSGRLMWLASFRIAEIIACNHPLRALRSELRFHGLCEEIVLDSFSEKEVGEYLADRASSVAANEEFVRGLHERTEGLPLFVAHVVDDLIARGGFGEENPSGPIELLRTAIPETLALIIDRYVAKLGTEQRVVLEAAAVCGVEFRVDTVAAVLGQEPAAVAAVCDEIARAQLWLSAPARDTSLTPIVPYAFRHAVFREVLYERVGPLARRQLHRKVGVVLDREKAAGLPVAAAELATHFEYGAEPLTASKLYAEAAESALSRFAVTEALGLTERGITLLDRVQPNADRSAIEFSLWMLRGVAAAHVFGMSSAEAEAALLRAHALLASVPQHPMRGLMLYELCFVLCLRGKYAEAMALAELVEALSRQKQDPALILGSCIAHGHIEMLRGRPRISREWFERGLSVTETPGPAVSDAPAIGDPVIALLGHLAVQLIDLGLIEQARARLDELRMRTRQLANPLGDCVAIWLQALCEVRLGDTGRVADLAKQMQSIVEQIPFAHGHVACRLFGGWAEAHVGDAMSGYRTIRDAYEQNLRLGMRAGSSETLGYAAEALLHAGDPAGAAVQLDEALQIADELGERVYLPQLFLIEAAIAEARGDPQAALASIQRARMEARDREASWNELLAMLELCKRADAKADDYRALAVLVDSLPEATDTMAVATARSLLGQGNEAG